jgi:hypothetical protein
LVKEWALPALAVVTLVMGAQYIFGYKITVNKYKNAHHVHERYATPSVALLATFQDLCLSPIVILSPFLLFVRDLLHEQRGRDHMFV